MGSVVPLMVISAVSVYSLFSSTTHCLQKNRYPFPSAVHVLKQVDPHHSLITAEISSPDPEGITVRVHEAVVPEKDKPGTIDNARGVAADAVIGIETNRISAVNRAKSRFFKIVTSSLLRFTM